MNDQTVCEAEVLVLQDGGLKVLLGGKAHTVNYEKTKVGLKIHVDGHPCFFPDDFDPTKMCAPGTGKLLRYLVPDGGRAVEGVAYCEIEVMKTVMPLMATSTGVVAHKVQPGSALETGDELCAVAVEDPSAGESVPSRSAASSRSSPVESSPARSGTTARSCASTSTRRASCSSSPGTISTRRKDPVTPLLEVLGTMKLAVDDFSETKQAVSSRASKAALDELAAIENLMRAAVGSKDDDGRRASLDECTDVVSVAVARVKALIDEHGPDFLPLRAFVDQFEGGLHMNRVRVLTRYLETYLDAEEPFACSASFEDAVMLLRSRYKGDAAAVVQYAHAHSRLARRSGLVLKILDEVSAHDMTGHRAVPRRGQEADEARVRVARRVQGGVLPRQGDHRSEARRVAEIATRAHESDRTQRVEDEPRGGSQQGRLPE